MACGLWFASPCSGGPGRQSYDISSMSGTVCTVGIHRRKRALTFFFFSLGFYSFFSPFLTSLLSQSPPPPLALLMVHLLWARPILGALFPSLSHRDLLYIYMYVCIHTYIHIYGSVVKNPPAMQQETWIRPLGSGRSPGEGSGNPLQYSSLGNPVDRGAWRATVHGVAKSWT